VGGAWGRGFPALLWGRRAGKQTQHRGAIVNVERGRFRKFRTPTMPFYKTLSHFMPSA